jgi:choline dehydrogenase
VLLVEAGGSDKRLVVTVPVGYLHCIGNPTTDFMYELQPEQGLSNRVLRYPRGKVMGGCSSINGMIYMRGQRDDYNGWASMLGDASWRWDNVLGYFLRHEDHWDPNSDSKMHGHGGEW